MVTRVSTCTFFFFNDTATTEIYTLSLHDALPILTTVELYTPKPSAWDLNTSSHPIVSLLYTVVYS